MTITDNLGLRITVFHHKGVVTAMSSAEVVNTLYESGYRPFVDGIHGTDLDWLRTNFYNVAHRFVQFTGFGFVGAHVTELSKDSTPPSFVIYYDDGVKVSDEMWYKIIHYFEGLFTFDHPVRGPRILTRHMVAYIKPPSLAFPTVDVYKASKEGFLSS